MVNNEKICFFKKKKVSWGIRALIQPNQRIKMLRKKGMPPISILEAAQGASSCAAVFAPLLTRLTDHSGIEESERQIEWLIRQSAHFGKD